MHIATTVELLGQRIAAPLRSPSRPVLPTVRYAESGSVHDIERRAQVVIESGSSHLVEVPTGFVCLGLP